jgi:hypothetical protein
MAHVIDLQPAVAASGDTPLYKRIRLASRGFEWLFTAMFGGMILLVVAMVVFILFDPWGLASIGKYGAEIDTHPPAGFALFSSLGWDQRIAYAFVSLVRSAPALAMFWLLRALFRLYAQGVVFARENASLIKWAGLCLIADAFAPFICHVALGATGYEIDRNWFHFEGVQELILGGLVVVIAQVMQVGREIEEERGQFV